MRKPLAASNRKVWLSVYTAAAVTIIIGGSLYGAELATKQEKKKVLDIRVFNVLYDRNLNEDLRF